MAALFRDFSFDAPSPRSADLQAERALMNCSPTSKPAPPAHAHARPLTPPPCTVGDLAQLMGGQSLFVSTTRAYAYAGPPAPPTPPSEDDSSFSTAHDPRASRPTYCRASASIMRMQRQAHSRLQCCASQARDISRLVRMIEHEEQCSITSDASSSRSASSSSCSSSSPSSTSTTARTADDEAIDMDYDCSLRSTEPLFSRPLYRAGDRHNDSARVTKHVRMRKRSSLAREPKDRTRTT